MSQPSARRTGRFPAPGARSPGGLCTLVISLTVSARSTRAPSSSPEFSIMRAKRARSAVVVKRDACPATPPMLRAMKSSTCPRCGALLGATRGSLSAAGRKPVSFMPSGRKISAVQYSSNARPVAFSIAAASSIVPTLL